MLIIRRVAAASIALRVASAVPSAGAAVSTLFELEAITHGVRVLCELLRADGTRLGAG